MSKPSAAIVGGAAGALALVAIVIGVVWFYKTHCKNLSNKNSETGSSDPSAIGKDQFFFMLMNLESFNYMSCYLMPHWLNACSVVNHSPTFLPNIVSGME